MRTVNDALLRIETIRRHIGAPSTSSSYGIARSAASAAPAATDRADLPFASVLAHESAQLVSTRAMGPIAPPRGFLAYGNGRIPLAMLRPIGQGEHRLAPQAAQAFLRMATAATRDGQQLIVSQSYRSLPEQEQLEGTLGRYRDGGLAADAGTSSHGWGLSVDLTLDESAQAWMRANAGRFGFAEDVAREPWHWTYRPPSVQRIQ